MQTPTCVCAFYSMTDRAPHRRDARPTSVLPLSFCASFSQCPLGLVHARPFYRVVRGPCRDTCSQSRPATISRSQGRASQQPHSCPYHRPVRMRTRTQMESRAIRGRAGSWAASSRDAHIHFPVLHRRRKPRAGISRPRFWLRREGCRSVIFPNLDVRRPRRPINTL